MLSKSRRPSFDSNDTLEKPYRRPGLRNCERSYSRTAAESSANPLMPIDFVLKRMCTERVDRHDLKRLSETTKIPRKCQGDRCVTARLGLELRSCSLHRTRLHNGSFQATLLPTDLPHKKRRRQGELLPNGTLIQGEFGPTE
jgi:hypothetical protein